MEIIKPGHYVSNYTINSENKEIIRILGESDKQGLWLTDEKVANKFGKFENKLISESELLNNYTFIETSITEESKTNIIVNKNLFNDFDLIENEDIVIIEESKPIIKKIISEESKSIIPIKQLELDTEDLLIKTILDKISLSKNNKPKNVLNLNIQIEIDYDIDKLKNTIELLNIDIIKLTNLIIKENELNGNSFNKNLNDNLLKILSDEKSEPIIEQTKNESIIDFENKYNKFNERLIKFYETK